MAEVVNLRRARKARARTEARKTAEASAARHGERRETRVAREAEAETLRRTLDGAKREGAEREPGADG